jgi:hypothetical protein
MDNVRKRKTLDELKRMVEQSGYAGERLAFMHPTDQLIYTRFHRRGRCVPQDRHQRR